MTYTGLLGAVIEEFMPLTAIPRPSHHEEAVASYLIEWADNHGFSVIKDNIGNVIIDKPASCGMEKIPLTIIQAHMDMVCVADEGIEYDPLNDPIKVINDGAYITADGTSLGADDGIGIAIALFVLANDKLAHGPLRAIFTVNEEDGMDSMNMDPKFFCGDYLINLDWESLGSICNSCAGGDFMNFSRKYELENTKEGEVGLIISVNKLLGGHSGVEINLGHANAIITLVFFLHMLKKEGIKLKIAEINGGKAPNAIPDTSKAVITIPSRDKERIEEIFVEFKKLFMTAYGRIEKEGVVSVTWLKDTPKKVINEKISSDLIDIISVVPNNVHTMSPFIDGLVESSSNLGMLKTNDNEINFHIFSRSSVDYPGIQIINICKILSEKFWFDLNIDGHVPGWAVNPNSKLTKIACEQYEKITGEKMVVEPVHAGVECGAFAIKNPNLDMIAIGPTLTGVHTPNERCRLRDVEVTTLLLLKILANIK